VSRCFWFYCNKRPNQWWLINLMCGTMIIKMMRLVWRLRCMWIKENLIILMSSCHASCGLHSPLDKASSLYISWHLARRHHPLVELDVVTIKLPFGLINVGDTFQRTMDIAFAEENDHFIMIYVDDMTFFSRTEEEHLVHLKRVFLKCCKYGLSLNPEHFFFVVIEWKFVRPHSI
jgi:hypothetical protein